MIVGSIPGSGSAFIGFLIGTCYDFKHFIDHFLVVLKDISFYRLPPRKVLFYFERSTLILQIYAAHAGLEASVKQIQAK